MCQTTKGSKPKSQETQRLQRIFDIFDTENTGRVPLRRLQHLLSRVDLPELSIDERQILIEKISKADENKDDFIDKKEFFKLFTQPISSDGNLLKKLTFFAADLVTPDNQKHEVYSYLNEYSCRPPPLFMLLISAVEVAIFLYYALEAGLAPGWLYGCPGCTVDGKVGPLVYHPLWKKEAWRYATYMLVHAGIEHLMGNVFLQLILGIPLELVHKMWRVGPLYIAGVLLGSLLQSAVDPYVALVGASGGCYALLAAHLANVILNWSEMPWRWVRFGVISIFVGSDITFAVYRRYYLTECDRVSYMAHVGGALAGLLLGIVILKNIRRVKWERALWWVCLVFFASLVLACIVLNILFNPGDPAIFTTRCKIANSTGQS